MPGMSLTVPQQLFLIKLDSGGDPSSHCESVDQWRGYYLTREALIKKRLIEEITLSETKKVLKLTLTGRKTAKNYRSKSFWKEEEK